MEWSEYNGPYSKELEDVWPSLSEEQQAEIIDLAINAFPRFAIAVMVGDLPRAETMMLDVVRETHTIAGI